MKKTILILFLSSILFSCSKSKADNHELVNSNNTENLNEDTGINPITIEYSNNVNGYKISVNWIIKEYVNYHDIRYFVGPATLKFTNVDNGEVFFIQHPEYSIDISKENLKYINLENADIFKGNKSFTQKNKYISPSTTIVGEFKVVELEDYDKYKTDEYIPFFFQDVNFDNKKELILTCATKYDKGGSQNILFSQQYGNEFEEMNNEPFNNFNGFYNGYLETLAYSSTQVDYKNKRIIEKGICGASCTTETVYEFKKDESGYTLFKKTELNDDFGNKETIITSYNEIGKPISIKATKVKTNG